MGVIATTFDMSGGGVTNFTKERFSSPNLNNSISQIISRRQEELSRVGINQGQIAEEIGTSQQTLSRIKRFGEKMLGDKLPDEVIQIFKHHRFTTEEASALAELVYLRNPNTSAIYAFLKSREQ